MCGILRGHVCVANLLLILGMIACLRGDAFPTWRAWTGSMPAGSLPSSISAGEQESTTEDVKATAYTGGVYQFSLPLPCTLTASIHMCALVAFGTLSWPLGLIVTSVGVDHLPGGGGCLRERPGKREGECRSGADANAPSGASCEEGE